MKSQLHPTPQFRPYWRNHLRLVVTAVRGFTPDFASAASHKLSLFSCWPRLAHAPSLSAFSPSTRPQQLPPARAFPTREFMKQVLAGKWSKALLYHLMDQKCWSIRSLAAHPRIPDQARGSFKLYFYFGKKARAIFTHWMSSKPIKKAIYTIHLLIHSVCALINGFLIL